MSEIAALKFLFKKKILRNYVCKKETTLKKYMIAKHEEHQCKDCHVNLSSFMELMKHIAKHHCKEDSEDEEIKEQKEKQDC